MKFLVDLFPVILFFGIFKWGENNLEAAQGLVHQYLSGLISSGAPESLSQAPIMLATAVAILASIVQIAFLLARRRKVEPMMWISLAIIVVFGGATIYFQNETFIKWKPTVLYWAFGAALLGSQVLLGKNLIKLLMGKQIELPEPVWHKLNLSWAGFFIFMGMVNLFVAYSYPTATWVSFKLFGFTGLMVAFVIGQSFFLSKHIKDPQ